MSDCRRGSQTVSNNAAVWMHLQSVHKNLFANKSEHQNTWRFLPGNYGVDNLLLSFLNEEIRLRCVAGQINKEIAQAFAVRCFKTKGIMAVCACV